MSFLSGVFLSKGKKWIRRNRTKWVKSLVRQWLHWFAFINSFHLFFLMAHFQSWTAYHSSISLWKGLQLIWHAESKYCWRQNWCNSAGQPNKAKVSSILPDVRPSTWCVPGLNQTGPPGWVFCSFYLSFEFWLLANMAVLACLPGD